MAGAVVMGLVGVAVLATCVWILWRLPRDAKPWLGLDRSQLWVVGVFGVLVSAAGLVVIAYYLVVRPICPP